MKYSVAKEIDEKKIVMQYEWTSKFQWMLYNIRIEKIILTLNLGNKTFLGEVSALLDVKHCAKLHPCAISKKTNDATLGNGKNNNYGANFLLV